MLVLHPCCLYFCSASPLYILNFGNIQVHYLNTQHNNTEHRLSDAHDDEENLDYVVPYSREMHDIRGVTRPRPLDVITGEEQEYQGRGVSAYELAQRQKFVYLQAYAIKYAKK